MFRIDVLDTGDSFYTGEARRNPDWLAHAAIDGDFQAGVSRVGFEDIFRGGDRDYDDVIFSVSNTVAVPAVPEPAHAALLLAGLGVLGLRGRWRRG